MALHPQAQALIDLAEEVGMPDIDSLTVDDARALYNSRPSGLEAPEVGEVRIFSRPNR